VKVVLRENLTQEARRTREVLVDLWEREKERLVSQLGDYAQWVDMGEEGVQKRNALWLKENLEPWVREQFGYEVVLFAEEREVITMSPGWVVPLEKLPQMPWVGVYGSGEMLSLVAFQPVMDNSGERFYGGYLGFARTLDEGVFENWERVLGGSLRYRSSGETFLGGYSWKKEPVFTYEGGVLSVSFPLTTEEGKVLGTFQVEKEYRGTLRLYTTVQRVFLFSLLLVVFFILFLSRFLVGWILKPIDELRRSTTKIRKGEYDLELAIARNDEVGELARDFSRMAEALKKREEDLTVEKRRAERLANLDALTHIPNRRFLEKSVESFVQEGRSFALAFVDLDGFKKVNDLLGHSEGDNLLRRIARWFERNVRREDVVVRYGGDEFCFLFPGLNREEAEEIMERLLLRFLEKDFAGGISLSFSYGVAVYPAEAQNLDELLARSDQEMYVRKRGKSLADC